MKVKNLKGLTLANKIILWRSCFFPYRHFITVLFICSFPIYIYIYIYIYTYIFIHRKSFVVSQLFIAARHVGHLKVGSKHAQLYVRFSIIPISQQVNDVRSGIIRHYVVAPVCLHFCLTRYESAQFIRRVFHYASVSRQFLRQSAQAPLGSVYIVIHRQTVSLSRNSSVWLDI